MREDEKVPEALNGKATLPHWVLCRPLALVYPYRLASLHDSSEEVQGSGPANQLAEPDTLIVAVTTQVYGVSCHCA
jgi:hypothetical protein